MAGLVKAVETLRNHWSSPSLHLQQSNPKFDLEGTSWLLGSQAASEAQAKEELRTALREQYEAVTWEVQSREQTLERRSDQLREWAHTSTIAMRRSLARESRRRTQMVSGGRIPQRRARG